MPFVSPDYDTASLDTTRDALLTLVAEHGAHDRAFGRLRRGRPSASSHRHGQSAGAACLNRRPSTSTLTPAYRWANYRLDVSDVPVDVFWSISVYNAAGYFEPTTKAAVQHQQRHRRPQRRRLDHDPLRRRATNPTRSASWMAGTTPSASIGLTSEILDGSWTFPTLQRRAEA